MKSSDDELNQLLNDVKVVPPRSNLAERIIMQAQPPSHLQTECVNESGFLRQIVNSLVFPKPGYALACSMLIGVLVGWQNPDINTNTVQRLSVNEELSVDEALSSLFLAEITFSEDIFNE